ncbi:hypothetical protein TGMAS_267290 [Toxoplasma gondii MAS]|uniref:Uncharacterized protein n=2 Tax=Toxoplasma gondii TaxID=5811 RepID=A0A086QMC9_TOXGO|nr:hypothetical protein TGMAS_267290 [Toxoplasma gondii MAS]PUA85487.1 hypothetical protein TGBR9_267290 [Toxoplasma gondii TgCATBr9]
MDMHRVQNFLFTRSEVKGRSKGNANSPETTSSCTSIHERETQTRLSRWRQAEKENKTREERGWPCSRNALNSPGRAVPSFSCVHLSVGISKKENVQGKANKEDSTGKDTRLALVQVAVPCLANGNSLFRRNLSCEVLLLLPQQKGGRLWIGKKEKSSRKLSKKQKLQRPTDKKEIELPGPCLPYTDLDPPSASCLFSVSACERKRVTQTKVHRRHKTRIYVWRCVHVQIDYRDGSHFKGEKHFEVS